MLSLQDKYNYNIFMKKFLLPLRNIFVGLSVLCVGAYLCAYLLLPFSLNSKDYSTLITKEVKRAANLDLVIIDYKASVSPKLNLTFNAKEVQLFYPNKVQILDLKDANLDFSTLALFRKEFQIQKISASKLQISTKLLKNGKFSLQDYLEKNYKNDEKAKLKLSSKIPEVEFKEIIIKIKDEKSGQKFKLHDNNFRISKSLLSGLDVISTSGSLYYFDEKYFSHKVKLTVPETFFDNLKFKPIIISVDNLQKHKPHGTIAADLRIAGTKNNEIYGFVNIDNFTIIADKKKLPPSYFHLSFDKDKGVLDSAFYAAKDENVLMNAKFNTGHNNKVYMKCSTKMIHLNNLKPVAVAIFDLLRIPNKLGEFSVSGFAVADFEVETDMKTVKSIGHLKIADSQIKHKDLPLAITGISADVDFANNNIKIRDSKMFVNAQPVELKGKIDSNAYANIVLSAKNLNLPNLINAFDFLKPAKDLTILCGNFSMDAKIKGQLKTAAPDISAQITGLSAKHTKSKSKVSFETINAVVTDAAINKYKGIIKLNGLKYSNDSLSSYVSSSGITVEFNEKDLGVVPSKLLYDKASVTIEGSVKDYKTSPSSVFRAFGTVDTGLLKSFFPDNVDVYNKGVLPIGLQIVSANNAVDAECNVLASEDAYISPVLFSGIGNSVFHLKAVIKDGTIKIKDSGLFYPPKSLKLSDKLNTLNLRKIVLLSGDIKNNSLQDFRVSIPEKLRVKSPPVQNLELNGNIRLNGNLNSPLIQGVLNISNILMPSFEAKNIDLHFDKKNINMTLTGAKIENTTFNIQADASSDFLKTNLINNLRVTAEYVDIDNLIKLSSLLPQAKYSPGTEAPFDIAKGSVLIKNIKLNRIKASQVVSDMRIKNNVMYFDNLRANAYGGNAAAKITYNFPYLSTYAKIQARNLDSALAATALLPIGNQVSGKLNFDSEITMSGLTESQQLKTMRGDAHILITNAMLGPLGRFEHFLHAQNLLSQKFIYASLNSAKRAIAPKNTGYVDNLKGTLKFNNGYIHISPLTTSGPQMSMYVSGNINMLTEIVDVEILGKVSPDVSDSVGALGDVTLKNFIDEHTKYGETVSALFKTYNTELPEMDISKIPPLSSSFKAETKNFRVLIEGDPQSVKSIKSFTWVNPSSSMSKIIEETKTENPVPKLPQIQNIQPVIKSPETVQQPSSPVSQPAGFLDSIPDNFE